MALIDLLRVIMIDYMTSEEWEIEIGHQVRDLRLRQNIDQQRLAEQAGVALNAVKRLEGGKGITLTSFIKILRALGRVEWLSTLAPAVSISPMQMLNRKSERQRASANKGAKHV
jgi:transcriptional regulator with XRE-family HTH domain